MVSTAFSHRDHRLHADQGCNESIIPTFVQATLSGDCCQKAKKWKTCTSVVHPTHVLMSLYSVWTHTHTCTRTHTHTHTHTHTLTHTHTHTHTHTNQARTQGGFTVANEPPWKFQVSFQHVQNHLHARSLRASASTFVFAIDHGRVSSHAHATFSQLSRI